jgi:hypothetical protein
MTDRAQIDLGVDNSLTVGAVRELLASKDDSQPRQLRVSEAGIVTLSDVIGNTNLEGVRFRLETWVAGNGYTGPAAAADDAFVERIRRAIDENWRKGTRGLVDMF